MRRPAFADAFRRYTVNVLGFDPENIIDLRMPDSTGNVTVLTASSAREVASWNEAVKHGFSRVISWTRSTAGRDADGDGSVTAGEAKAHLDRHITRSAPRTFRRHQDADLRGDGEASGLA